MKPFSCIVKIIHLLEVCGKCLRVDFSFFIEVAAFGDKQKIKEVEANRYFSKGQHRGNVGEGQLHLNRENINDFSLYEVRSVELSGAIRKAYQRQQEDALMIPPHLERPRQV